MAGCGVCRLLSLAVRSACAPGLSAQVRVLFTSCRIYSQDSFPSGHWRDSPGGAKSCTSVGGAQRNLSAVAVSLKDNRHLLSPYDALDMEKKKERIRKALSSKTMKKFIINPGVAQVVADHLSLDLKNNKSVIFEINPGPGVLTRTLLNSGAQRLVLLEGNKIFLPDLRDLENDLDGLIKVVYCDFYKLDPIGCGSMRPPAMYSEKLFTDLGISEVPWTADVPVKVVGVLSWKNSTNFLWKLIYSLFERLSIFRYGRVELIVFVSEKHYTKMTANPGDSRKYQALSALLQMSCDIKLLHKEPWSSFFSTPLNKSLVRSIPKSTVVPNDHLCLVRITPRADLFSQRITHFNSSILVMMVRQCLARKTLLLSDKLNLWSPGIGEELLAQVGLDTMVLTGDVNPSEYKRLFEVMEQSEKFSHSWLYSEALENIQKMGYEM